MATKIYNLIILDESGSMERIKQQAVDGVNETIQSIRMAQQENENQEHFVSFVTFNTVSTVLYNCCPVNKVNEITDKVYVPCGCTALYDAMGMSLTELRTKVTKDDKVLVTVVTDGEENSSREYDSMTIKKIVDDLKDEGWIFTYIGANQDVTAVASTISITNVMEFSATSEGTRDALREERSCRRELYRRMNDVDFCPRNENVSFFRKKKE